MNLTTIATAVATTAFASIATARWLRVSQREHYHPGRATSVSGQWWKVQPATMAPVAVGTAAWAASFMDTPAAPYLPVVAAACGAMAPYNLPIRNTDQKLKVTPRVQRLIGATVVLGAGLLAARPNGQLLAAGALAAPLLVDAASAIAKPIEKAVSMRFVKQAHNTLTQLQPTVVALTGSYGKTTTKNYTAHLLSETKQTLPTPGSFNNLMGLTRSVNEHMQPGTEVFVAEMGTYGPGEITELCRWFTPDISAIISIGEAHLERMGSRETIVQAKSEILPEAGVWVLNTDTPELADIADSAPSHVQVIRCSATSAQHADVAVLTATNGDLEVHAGGDKIATFTPVGSVHPINVAVAVAVARHEGVPDAVIARRVDNLPTVASRGATSRTEDGVTIIDDTFNSNPTGALSALSSAAAQVKDGSTLWVVTPGMFELGDAMSDRNREFAAAVFAETGAQLVAVGGTNRKAFEQAAADTGSTDRITWFGTRAAAVNHVMGKVAPGDVVLYENDRPDHLP